MKFIDPLEHDERGTPFPYWIDCGSVDREKERQIKNQVSDVLGSVMIAPDPWAMKFKSGFLMLMFRTTEDRFLAMVAIA